MEEGYKIIDHTADYGIEVYAGTLEGIFEHAARGMYSLITDVSRVENKKSIEFEVDGDDIETLLVDFLNELLFYTDTEGFLLKECKVNLSNNKLKANCKGENYDSSRHELVEAVKAATYHMLEIKKENKKFKATVIFDV